MGSSLGAGIVGVGDPESRIAGQVRVATFLRCKDGPCGPLSGRQTARTLIATGRCEPRRVHDVSRLATGEPAAPTPRAAGFSISTPLSRFATGRGYRGPQW